MGTLTITAAGFTGGPNGSKAFTVNDTDWNNLISYMQAKFTPNVSPQNPNPTAPTPAQALLAWVQDWISQTRDEIRSSQLRTAQQEAAAGVSVPPIVFT